MPYKRPMTEQERRHLSELRKGQPSWWQKEGFPNPFTSEYARKRTSESHVGRPPWNVGVPRTQKEKAKMSEGQKRRAREKPETFHRGADHYMWRGGRFPYYGEDWSQRRREALARDGFKCRICGTSFVQLKSKRHLHVHHIIPRFKGGTNDLDNLVTLCYVCHNEVEGRMRVVKEEAEADKTIDALVDIAREVWKV